MALYPVVVAVPTPGIYSIISIKNYNCLDHIVCIYFCRRRYSKLSKNAKNRNKVIFYFSSFNIYLFRTTFTWLNVSAADVMIIIVFSKNIVINYRSLQLAALQVTSKAS